VGGLLRHIGLLTRASVPAAITSLSIESFDFQIAREANVNPKKFMNDHDTMDGRETMGNRSTHREAQLSPLAVGGNVWGPGEGQSATKGSEISLWSRGYKAHSHSSEWDMSSLGQEIGWPPINQFWTLQQGAASSTRTKVTPGWAGTRMG
jgi:hypothetical protein